MAASAGAIRAGRAFVELSANDSKLQGTLRRVQQRMQNLGTTLLATGAAIGAPLLAATKSFASYGDELNKASARTGLAVESLSQLRFAAQQSGTDFKSLETSVARMQRTISDAGRGLSTATDAFEEIGISLNRLEGQTPEEQFKLIAEGLSRIEDPSQRAATAMQIFGRSGTKLLPMINNGREGIEALQAEAERLGLTISTDDAQAAADLTDQMNRLWQTVKVGVFQVGAALAPVLIDAAGIMRDVAATVRSWIQENETAIKLAAAFAAGLVAIGGGLLAASTAIRIVNGLLRAYQLATKAAAATQAFLLSLAGPAGWAKVAAGVTVAVAAYATINATLADTEERAAAAAKESEGAAEAIKKAGNALDDIDGGAESMGDFADEANRAADAVERLSAAERGRFSLPLEQLQRLADDGPQLAGGLKQAADEVERIQDALRVPAGGGGLEAFEAASDFAKGDAAESLRGLRDQLVQLTALPGELGANARQAIQQISAIASARQQLEDDLQDLLDAGPRSGEDFARAANAAGERFNRTLSQETKRLQETLQATQELVDVFGSLENALTAANRVLSAVETPEEKLARTRKEIEALAQLGLLDAEQRTRALTAALEDFDSAIGGPAQAIADLKDEIADFGRSDVDQFLAGFTEATDEQIAMLRELFDERERLEKQQQRLAEAERLNQQFQGPLETLNNELANLKELQPDLSDEAFQGSLLESVRKFVDDSTDALEEIRDPAERARAELAFLEQLRTNVQPQLGDQAAINDEEFTRRRDAALQALRENIATSDKPGDAFNAQIQTLTQLKDAGLISGEDLDREIVGAVQAARESAAGRVGSRGELRQFEKLLQSNLEAAGLDPDAAQQALQLAVRGGLETDLDKAVTDVSARGSDVTGTFSAFAARGLGASSPAERTMKAAEKTAENTEKLIDEVKQVQVNFV